MLKTIRSWFTKRFDVSHSPFIRQTTVAEQVFEIIPEDGYTIEQVAYLLNRGEARLVLSMHNVVTMGDTRIAKLKVVSRPVHHAPRYDLLEDLGGVRDRYLGYEDE